MPPNKSLNQAPRGSTTSGDRHGAVRRTDAAICLGVFAAAVALYALVGWTIDNALFVTQVLVVPAVVALKMIGKVIPVDLELGWLDVDSTEPWAELARSIAFGLTVLLVFIPSQLYRRRPTTVRRAIAIVAWLFIAFALALFVLLILLLAGSGWTD